jgi:hypothetical protein
MSTSRIQKKYDIDLLKQVAERDNISIDYEKLGKISSIVYIDFICKCGSQGNKTFRLMFQNGALCKECMIHQQQIKSKETCIEKYNTHFAIQSKEIKEKMKNSFNLFSEQKKQDIKDKKIKTCLSKYGTQYATQNKDVQDKITKTSIRLYGVKRASQLDTYKKLAEQTCLSKYGVKYAIQSEHYKNKSIQTCLSKYGVKYPIQLSFFKQKRELTNMFKYGVKSSIQLSLFKNKRVLTSLKRYGVVNGIQNKEIKEKRENNCFEKYGVKYTVQLSNPYKKYKLKMYIFPNEKIQYVQGYEPFALDDLVQHGYTSEDILTCRSHVPSIWYLGPDLKRHRYFVDIYIPKINKMIEVKSLYTYNKHLDTVLLKAKECIAQGYLYEIWIYNYKKEKTIISQFA